MVIEWSEKGSGKLSEPFLVKSLVKMNVYFSENDGNSFLPLTNVTVYFYDGC